MLQAPSRIPARAPSPSAREPVERIDRSLHRRCMSDHARFESPAQEQNSKKMADTAKDLENVTKQVTIHALEA